jgi:hypothetical protein
MKKNELKYDEKEGHTEGTEKMRNISKILKN